MIEWLKGLTSPLKYVVYVAGALLLFFVAVGMGAAAAVVVAWSPEPVVAHSGSSDESGIREVTKLETTGNTGTLENTTIKPINNKEASPQESEDETSFVHRATDENSRGDYTYISDPSIDGNPKAVVLVTPTSDREGTADATYRHNVGVWYEFVNKKEWAIFNQDRWAVPNGATFEVVIPPASKSFVHHAGLINTVGNTTYLDNPLTNGKPNVAVSVTQNWNPGGGRGVYNNHAISALYDKDVQKWAIYNRDGAPMPDGAAFNVAVSGGANEPVR
ncbi:MAG TPA: hypothetical protein VJ827_04120 [Rubrobacter sp.]|nr:hypothetical protein [Rubrobacter sp.]